MAAPTLATSAAGHDNGFQAVPGGPAVPQKYVAVDCNPLQSPQVRSYQQNALARGHCLDTDSCRLPPDELVMQHVTSCARLAHLCGPAEFDLGSLCCRRIKIPLC